MANELRSYQNYLGGRLSYDLPATSTVITDGVTNSTTTVTSATAAFTDADVGATITGTDMPAGAYIVSRTNATTVVISAAATGTGSARTLTINRHLVMHTGALAATLTIGTSSHMMVTLDPDGMVAAPETVMITKHDSASTWAQIVRAQEGTIVRAHASGADWVHSVLASDMKRGQFKETVYTPAVDLTTVSATYADIDTTNLPALGFVLEVGDAVDLQFTGTFGHSNTGNIIGVDWLIDRPTSGDTDTRGSTWGAGVIEMGSSATDANIMTVWATFVATEAGPHTFIPQWRRSGGTGYLRGAASTYHTPIRHRVTFLGPKGN